MMREGVVNNDGTHLPISCKRHRASHRITLHSFGVIQRIQNFSECNFGCASKIPDLFSIVGVVEDVEAVT